MPRERLNSRINREGVLRVTSQVARTQSDNRDRALARMEELLRGDDAFYERIFEDLKLPHQPVRWEIDTAPGFGGPSGAREEVEKQARVLQLIRAYRVRGGTAHPDGKRGARTGSAAFCRAVRAVRARWRRSRHARAVRRARGADGTRRWVHPVPLDRDRAPDQRVLRDPSLRRPLTR